MLQGNKEASLPSRKVVREGYTPLNATQYAELPMPPARLFVFLFLLAGGTLPVAAPQAGVFESVPETAPSAASPAAPGYRIGDLLVAPKETKDGKPRRVIRLLVTKFAEPNGHYPVVAATVKALQKAFGEDRFEARIYTGETDHIRDAHLVLSSVGTFVRARSMGARDLATVASERAPDPNRAEGTLFVTLKNRADINQFEDLRGKRVTATGSNAFSGYHVGLGEIAERGEDPDRFFGAFVASGYDMLRELKFLREGLADVAMLRTCVLEELAAAGGKVDDLKPLLVRENGESAACLSSTDTYPNWTLFALPTISPEEARLAAQTLLSMPELPGGIHWSIASDFTAVDGLYRSLRLGPYEYLRTWTWTRFWETYRTSILVALTFVLGLLLHSLRSESLVRRRTAELRRSLEEQRKAQTRARDAALRVEALRRAGAVGQMSSIIAHELRQPVATVRNYVQGLRRMLDLRGALKADVAEKPLLRLDEQAERIERIVERVRAYGRAEVPQRRPVDAVTLTKSAVETLRTARPDNFPVTIRSREPNCTILADPLEWELCVQNLVKNALEAVRGVPSPAVTIELEKQYVGGREKLLLCVTDNGPRLDEEKFRRLEDVLSSTKLDGLGLGLSIVRMIAEDSRGVLRFARNEPTGLRVVVEWPLPNEKAPDATKIQGRNA